MPVVAYDARMNAAVKITKTIFILVNHLLSWTINNVSKGIKETNCGNS